MIELRTPILAYRREGKTFELQVATYASLDPDRSLVYYNIRGKRIAPEGDYRTLATETNIMNLLPSIREIVNESEEFIYKDLLDYKQRFSVNLFEALKEI